MEFNYQPSTDAEKAHYGGLWTAAGPNSDGELSGLQAVTFFKQSGVDMGILKQIWSFSTPTATMNAQQFNNALRYITMFQNGDLPITKDRLAVSAKVDLGLPKFQGVTLPTPQQVFPDITPDLHARYYEVFLKSDTDKDGYVI